MRYNQLGNTGLFVSEICLGTMTFSEAGSGTTWDAIAGVGQKAADQIVERSLKPASTSSIPPISIG